MQIYQQKAEILRTEKFTGDIYRFSLKAPDIAAEARPGQFVMVRTGEGMDPLLRRPFSVHQVAEGGLVQILFKIVGRGTQLLSRMQSGKYLDVLGPLGQGFTNGENNQHFLVGGGIGIAPLLFLAKQLLKRNEPSAIKVLLGARTEDEIGILAEDFGSMGLEVLSATEDGSLGQKGLVTDLLVPINETRATVYGCGPYPMLRVVAGICHTKGWGCQVSLETIMACGLAACLGCTVLRSDLKGYVHVCKDGPVFNADEVAWL
ncbi:MAG: dihydroorotate dehydrogenase electron transfer subunit [Deltaproteobacteria bacterium]|jgi:dihydroorotate dehydrogenase electron transfer subunit|nr:dihydroorotate dehydrogenase electron transfer subunit [Deltaproteobacteria bacterium]